MRLGANAQNRHIFDTFRELGLVHRGRVGFHLITFFLELSLGIGVDVFQEQDFDSVFGIRDSGVHFVQVKKFVERWSDVVSHGQHRVARHVFGVGVKFIGQPGRPDFVVVVAVANHVHVAAQVEQPHHLGLAIVGREHVVVVETGNVVLVIKREGVGKHVIGTDPVIFHNGYDKLPEAVRDHVDAVGVGGEERPVVLKRARNTVAQAVNQHGQVGAMGRQQSQATLERLTERDIAFHAGVGDALHFFQNLVVVGLVGQSNFAEHVQCLHLGKGAVEVEDKVWVVCFHAKVPTDQCGLDRLVSDKGNDCSGN